MLRLVVTMSMMKTLHGKNSPLLLLVQQAFQEYFLRDIIKVKNLSMVEQFGELM